MIGSVIISYKQQQQQYFVCFLIFLFIFPSFFLFHSFSLPIQFNIFLYSNFKKKNYYKMNKSNHQTVISYLPYNSNMFYLQHFQKLSKGSCELIQKKKGSMLENMEKIAKNKKKDKNNQIYKFYKNQQDTNKFIKFHSQRDSSEIIDRILLKSALSNIKTLNQFPPNNTSIEFDDLALNKIKSGYNPNPNPNLALKKFFMPGQNEQQNKEKYIKSQRSIKKIDLNKLHAINEKRNIKDTKGESQWENSMNIVRLQKKENEKSKKQCRIMIRRINTDQLLTKSHESHPKRGKYQTRFLNASLKTIKPIIINKSSQTSFVKQQPEPTQRFNSPPLSQLEYLELNPWSTTELKPELMQQQ